MHKIKTRIDPNDTLKLLCDLSKLGFNKDAFPRLHHFHDSLNGFSRHCRKVKSFRENESNHWVHERLQYVLNSLENGKLPSGKTWESLADEAYKEIPRK